MDIINSRYHLKAKLDSLIPNVEEFLAADLWNQKELLNLKIFSDQDISNDVFTFLKNEFIIISSIDDHFYLKNYGFECIHDSSIYAVNKISAGNFYLCTTEYTENKIPVLYFIKNCSMQDILKIVVSACQALTYAGNRGFGYAFFSLQNVFIVKSGNDFKVRFKDIVSTKLEEPFSINLINYYDRVGINEDAELISSFIASLLLEKEIKSNSPKVLTKIKNQYKTKRLTEEENEIFICLLDIIKKAINNKNKFKIYDVIKDINIKLNKNYAADIAQPLKCLTFYPKIVKYNNYISRILNILKNIAVKEAGEKTFLIKGSSGMGKTRFLKEAEFFLSMENCNVYSWYNLKNLSSEEFWKNFLNKFLSYPHSNKKNAEIESMIEDIKDILKKQPALRDLNEYEKLKSKLLNTIRKCFLQKLNFNSYFIIIDDITSADDLMLDLFIYFSLEIAPICKMGLIFSYNSDEELHSEKLKYFLNIINAYKKVNLLELTKLSISETSEMIKNILLMNYFPKRLTQKVYHQTSGIPIFIIEIIKELVHSGVIYKDPFNGVWLIDESFFKNNLNFTNSTNIEKILQNQTKELSSVERKVLSAMAIFQNTFKIDHIYSLINISKKNIGCILEKLLNKGLISEVKDGKYIEYTISNKILRDIEYNKISNKKKIEMHKKAVSVLQKENIINKNKLLWHLKNAEKKRTIIKYYEQIALENLQSKKIMKAISNYEKILTLVNYKNNEQKFIVLLKLYDLYTQVGINQNENILQIEKILDNIKNPELISNFYYLKAKNYYEFQDIDNLNIILERLSELSTNRKSDIITIHYLLVKCMYFYVKNEYNAVEQNSLYIIDLSKGHLTSYKAIAYSFLGYVNYLKGMYKTSIEYFKEGRNSAIASYDIKIELLSLYNLSLLYSMLDFENHESLEYGKTLLQQAKKSGIEKIEILSLINYANLLSEQELYSAAYKYIRYAVKKINPNTASFLKFLVGINLMETLKDLNNYKAVFKLRKKYIYLLTKYKTPNSKFFKFSFYFLIARIYNDLGYYDKSYRYLKKITTVKQYKGEIKDSLIKFCFESCKILKNDISEINTLIKHFDEYKPVITNNTLKINPKAISPILLKIIIRLILSRPDIDFTPLLIEVLKYKKLKLYPFQQGCMLYFESYIDKANEANYLTRCLKTIRSTKDFMLIIAANIKLGLCYLKQKNISFAVINFLEAQNYIIHQLNNISEKHRLYLFNNSLYYMPFVIVNNFIQGKDIANIKFKQQRINLNELNEILKNPPYQILKKNKNFANTLVKSLLRKNNYENITYTNILTMLTNNFETNIKNIMHFLSVNLIATSYEIFIINSQNEFTPFFYTNEDNTDVNHIHNIIKAVGFKKISTIEKSSKFPCIIIPITLRSNKYKSSNLLGFMIFISKSIVNNFTKEGITLCKKYIGLLSTNIEGNNLKKIASIDKLTNALTKKYLGIALKDIFDSAINSNSKFSIILYDLDHFKNINDTYGHHTGDIVLKNITNIVFKNLEHEQKIGRYGGEEFIIILPDYDENQTLELAEKIRKKIEKLIFKDINTPITISLGIASYPVHASDINSLVLKADQALYSAKNEGRNRSRIWSSDYMNNSKNSDIVGVFVTDETKYAENISLLLEMTEIAKTNLKKSDLISAYAHKLLKIFNAENIAIIYLKENKNTNRKDFKIKYKIGFENYNINENIAFYVTLTATGIYQIDWDNIAGKNIITNLPEWNSVMVSPLINTQNVFGLVYITIQEKKHIFTLDDFKFFDCLVNIVAANILR